MGITPKQLIELGTAAIKARRPILVTGMPGCGKSDIIDQIVTTLGFDLLLEHPAVSDPTDYKGLPWAIQGASEATFLPFGNLARAINATVPTVWFFDDLGQAAPSVQAACMQLFLARRINGHKISDFVTFIGATNRRGDRSGVAGLLEAVKSRFASIVDLEPNLDDWCNWAYGANISPILIAFLRTRPDILAAFLPSADLTNSPTPRTWSNLAEIETWQLSQALEVEAMSGAVGNGAALEYITFRAMYRSIVNLDAILLNPDKASIPSKPSELYAVCTGLAYRATEQNFARIATYANRLATDPDSKGNTHGEFAVLLVRDCLRRNEKIAYTDSYVRMQCGTVGKLMSGSN